MKKKHISTFLSTLTTALLLAGTLSSCTGKILHQTTVGDLTYTLHGTNDRVEQITVSRDGRRIGAFQKRGLPGQISGDDYGFRLTDLNFDRHTDMQLLVAQAEAGDMYATYLWDAEAEKYVYHPQLSTLQDMGMIASLGVLTARESSVTIDPATDDTPEFEICRDAFILYRWEDNKLIPVHRKELTYYEESDIYCYLIEERNDRGEWETVRESWIAYERFDASKCPLDATGYLGYVPN
jgi:hypothetical protein